ncbi:MAG: alpha-amylase family protein [Ilumatobacteraceae bacterium]
MCAARMRRHWPTVEHGLAGLYPAYPGLAEELAHRVRRHIDERPARLFQRDLEREAEPDWFQHPTTSGYVAYADRFSGTITDIHAHLDHLTDLGITYLHLMPLLKPREGESDGGYAVASYDEVDARLGTTAELGELADELHARGMNLCIDLVVNHTAAEHPWALAARAGDPVHRAYYRFFPDRTMPDRFERTLRDVFPSTAPGNFTWLEDARHWVWTTFHDYQWDLDWSNPDVLREMIGVMLRLSDLGIDALRLDAVPFMWKHEGTACENLPEVHLLLCTLRSVMATAAPATIFKAEAIVPPDELTAYLGAGYPPRHECDLAYHNQLMVLLWSSLATGEAGLMTNSLQRIAPIPAHASWVTYVRCHDDIGWAITEDDAASMGWTGFGHRGFLNEFYSGVFPASFARGELFQFDPATGDGRISGTTAALCGIEQALADGDEARLDIACRRLELVYSVICGFGGVPLVYMGDELAMVNDHTYLDDPTRRDDNRWMHRPMMDWGIAERRHDPTTVEARVFGALRSLLADRAATPGLHGAGQVQVITPTDPALFVVVRRHPSRGSFAMVANFGQRSAQMEVDALGIASLTVVRASGASVVEGTIELAPLGHIWLATPR